jgi:hypothetical protein
MQDMNIEFYDVAKNQESSQYITGVVKRLVNFQSETVDPRNIDIWLPPSYEQSSTEKYPVLYMHDGQSLFEPGHTFTGQEWGVDEMMTKLVEENRIREAIVIGIWNTEKRFREYQPNKPFQALSQKEQQIRKRLDRMYDGGPLSDQYLKFIVDELKPYVDHTFRTLPDRENTFMMGSSMGGMISIYAIAEYPDVLIRYFKAHLPRTGRHKIYFDYGTETHDAWYEPYQKQMDIVMEAIGFTQGINWVTHKFEGEEHSEIAWRKRLDIPLIFLLGKNHE